MPKPLVSIIMSSYNHESYIEEALNSVFNQSYDNIEIILCDNCSSDNTFYKALEFCNSNNIKNIRCVVERNDQNLGVTRSLNRCLDFARGEYFFNLWTDDYIEKDCIETFVSYALKNTNFNGIYICETKDVDLKGNVLLSRKLDFLGPGGIVNKNIFWESLFSISSGGLMVVPYFSSIADLNKLGNFDVDYKSVEWDLYIRSNGGPGVFYVPHMLYSFRQIPKSAGSRTLEYADGILEAVVKYKGCFGEQYNEYLFKTKLRVVLVYLSNYQFKVGLNRSYKYLINEKSIINFFLIIINTFWLLNKYFIRYLIPVPLVNFYTYKIKKIL